MIDTRHAGSMGIPHQTWKPGHRRRVAGVTLGFLVLKPGYASGELSSFDYDSRAG